MTRPRSRWRPWASPQRPRSPCWVSMRKQLDLKTRDAPPTFCPGHWPYWKEGVTGFLCLLAEGDLYFTVKLQNYTAIEKDEVVLCCELSKAAGDVKWFKDGEEVFPSKNVLIQSDGRKRMVVIKKAARSSAGTYTCSCGTDRTSCELNIEGNRARPAGGRPTFTHHGHATACLCPPSLVASLLNLGGDPASRTREDDVHMWEQSRGDRRRPEKNPHKSLVSQTSSALVPMCEIHFLLLQQFVCVVERVEYHQTHFLVMDRKPEWFHSSFRADGWNNSATFYNSLTQCSVLF